MLKLPADLRISLLPVSPAQQTPSPTSVTQPVMSFITIHRLCALGRAAGPSVFKGNNKHGWKSHLFGNKTPSNTIRNSSGICPMDPKLRSTPTEGTHWWGGGAHCAAHRADLCHELLKGHHRAATGAHQDARRVHAPAQSQAPAGTSSELGCTAAPSHAIAAACLPAQNEATRGTPGRPRNKETNP